jgi:Transposase domain (DUF772)
MCFQGFSRHGFARFSGLGVHFLANFSGIIGFNRRLIRIRGTGMKPRERRETGQNDLFKARLDQIIGMGHRRVRLAQWIDWGFLEQALGAVYTDGPGSPPLPTRLMAGLHILKYSQNLSDGRLCEVWAGNPYFQYFCGEEFFQHEPVFDRSSMTRWRCSRRMPPIQRTQNS